MTVAELFGILTASAGLYLALSTPDGRQPLQIGPLRLTTGISAGVFVVTGLLVLLATNTQPSGWWDESSSAIESGIFWLAATAAIAGAFGLIRAVSPIGQMQSGVALASGGTCLFGTAGDVVAATTCLLVVGFLGWKLQTTVGRHSLSSSEHRPQLEAPDTSADQPTPPATANREPLVVTVTVMLLIWLLGSGIHSAVTAEARPSARSQNPRALPRPFLRDGDEDGDEDGDFEVDSEADVESDGEPTWQLIAIGLLVTTAGIAFVSPRRCESEIAADLPDHSSQVSS